MGLQLKPNANSSNWLPLMTTNIPFLSFFLTRQQSTDDGDDPVTREQVGRVIKGPSPLHRA